MGLEIDPNYGIWSQDEIDSLIEDGFQMDPQDVKDLQELNKKHDPATMIGLMGDVFYESENERILSLLKAGLILPPWKDKKGGSGGGFAMSGYGLGPGFSLVCVDYATVLNKGARGIINEAKQCLQDLRYDTSDAVDKRNFWEGVIIVFEAWVRFANRYADLCTSMAAEEKDEKRIRY